MLGDRLRDAEGAEDVGVVHLLHLVQGNLDKRQVGEVDACVVDQHVDPAADLDDARDRRLHALVLGHVELDPLDRLRQAGHLGDAARARKDVVAPGPREFGCELVADAAFGAAGDEHDTGG